MVVATLHSQVTHWPAKGISCDTHNNARHDLGPVDEVENFAG